MKKSICVALFTAFCLQQVQSQNRIGLVGGGLYARSNLTNQNQRAALFQSSAAFGNIYSFYGGIVYDIKVTNEFSIKSKLLYVNKGWMEEKSFRRDTIENISLFNIGQVSIPVESVKAKETYKFGYLELPVIFTFYMPVGKSLLSFGAGPYISFGLHGEYDLKALYSNKRITNSYTTSDSILLNYTSIYKGGPLTTNDKIVKTTQVTNIADSNGYLANATASIGFGNAESKEAAYTAYRYDFGASLEASVEFRLGVFVHAGYSVGVSNVIKEHYGALQNRHRIIMLGAGYYMRKRGKSSK